MKIVKINSIACPSCIIMNNLFNKLKDKYAKVVSSLPGDGICDKNGKKLNGIFKKLKPIEKDEKGKGVEKPLPG